MEQEVGFEPTDLRRQFGKLLQSTTLPFLQNWQRDKDSNPNRMVLETSMGVVVQPYRLNAIKASCQLQYLLVIKFSLPYYYTPILCKSQAFCKIKGPTLGLKTVFLTRRKYIC